MDWTEEFDSNCSLIELVQWGLDELGPLWAGSLDAAAVADVYRSRTDTRLDPWPAIGLEVHMPCRHGDRARVDFCLMSWETPGVLSEPAQWAYDDTLSSLRVAPTHRFLEFDAQGSDIRYMGQFFSVTEASALAFPAGLLRELRQALGRAPATAALIEGRGGRWPAAFFSIKTAAEWTRMVDAVSAAGIAVAGPEQFAALQHLQAASKATNVAVAVDEHARPLPYVGFEFFELGDSGAVRGALAKAGATVEAIEAFEDLRGRLPRIHTASRPIVPDAALDMPWQHRFLQLSHAKVNLRPEGLSLKWYLRLDTSAAAAFTGAGFASAPYGAAARAELRRTLRSGVDTTSEHFDALRSSCPYFDVVLPIVRGLWNDALARVPAADLPLFAEAARDAVVSAGIRRLTARLAADLASDERLERSPSQQVLQELGISDLDPPGASPEQIAVLTRHILAGDAPQPVMEHFYSVALPAAVEWIEAWREVAARVAADREYLWRHFGIAPESPLVRVQADAGDQHGGGRAVHLLWFAQGTGDIGIAYKPRDLRPDAAWYRLVAEWLAAVGERDKGWPTVLVRDGYGYVTVVPSSPPVDPEIYSRNAGRILAMLHLCDARDVHADNVVQTSAGPIPIDLECLWGGAEDGRIALDGVPVGSVAATGFLPFWVRTARGTWKNGGGLLSSLAPVQEESTNRYAPVAAPSLPQAEAFRSGFVEMYRLAMSQSGREALMRCGHSCLGAERRRVLRATRVYGLLLQELDEASPGLAGREAKLREIYKRLSQVRTERPPDDEVLNAEVAALSRGDIPRFVSVISPMDIARRASEVDLSWQLELLGAWSPTCKVEVASAERQLVNGWHTAPDGLQGWWGWEGPAGAAVRQLRWLPWTLYAGAVGPLLALAVLQSVEQDGTAKRLLRQALPVYRGAALEELQQRAFRWGLEGFSGHFRAVEALYGLGVEDAGSLDTVRQGWLAAALAADPADAKVDFTTGLAGAVGPLCRYAQQSQDESARMLVARLAMALMQRAPAMATDPSLAHGRAGVGLGLLEAGVLLGRPDWVSGALALWSPSPVVESATLQASWCRGHAGIALSRWVALQRLPDHSQAHRWQQVLREATPILQGSAANARGASSALSLCCGTVGALAALRVLGAAPTDAEWATVSRTMTERGKQSPPGLWTGLAGLVIARHAPVAILECLIA